jgi:CRISPR/Cas system CMR-associated protein Cmr5 small subunit
MALFDTKKEKLPAAPKLSIHAASVAQHVENLEHDLSEAQRHRDEEHNGRTIAESLLDEERQTTKRLQAERDYFHTAYVSVISQMEAGAQVFLRCLNHSKQSTRLKEGQPAIEQALTSVEEALHEKGESDV